MTDLKKLLDEATPGPWHHGGSPVDNPYRVDVVKFYAGGMAAVIADMRGEPENRTHDAALIVAAVNAVPELLALREENERLKQELNASENEAAMWQGKSERLGERIKPLEIALGELFEAFDEHVVLPEGGCSCHVSPPCNYCTDYGFAFHARESARAALNQEPGQ